MFTNIQSRGYGLTNQRQLYNSANANLDFIQRLKIEKRLTVHSGCVNTICWNEKGTTLLSGSDDQHLVISDPFSEKTVHKLHSGHRANIFSAKFLPSTGDEELVSCSGDGKIIYNNVLREDLYGTSVFDCHFGTTYEVIVIPNEASTFLSCGEDGTVRFFDLRAKSSCNKPDCKDDVIINSRRPVTSIAANPLLPWQLAVGCSDSTTRVYDRRMLGTRSTGSNQGKSIAGLISLFTPPSLENLSYRITSLNYSPDGEEILVSYSSEYIYLIGTKDSRVTQLNTTTDSDMVVQTKKITEDPADSPTCSTSEQPSSSGAQSIDTDDGSSEAGARPSSLKRLRLRGDWSDTGPGARPERERRQNPIPNSSGQPEEPSAENTRVTIMQRMSDLLTRWLDGNLRQNPPQDDDTLPVLDQPSVQAASSADTQSSDEIAGTLNEISMTGSQSNTISGASVSEEQGSIQNDCHDMTTASSTGVTTETDDPNFTEPVQALTSTFEEQRISCINNETDNQSVINEQCSGMYNPLEPTSYLDQANVGVSSIDNMDLKTAKKSDDKCEIESVQISSDIHESLGPDCASINTAGARHSEKNKPNSVTTTTVTDDSKTGLNIGEQSIIDHTRQTVDELKNRNVAPIISLHYSSEGTSYSNIRLQFAPLESAAATPGGILSLGGHQGNSVSSDGHRSDSVCQEGCQIKKSCDESSSESRNEVRCENDRTGNEIAAANNNSNDKSHGKYPLKKGLVKEKVNSGETSYAKIEDTDARVTDKTDSLHSEDQGRVIGECSRSVKTNFSELLPDSMECSRSIKTDFSELLPDTEESIEMDISDKVKLGQECSDTGIKPVLCDKGHLGDRNITELSECAILDTEQPSCSGIGKPANRFDVGNTKSDLIPSIRTDTSAVEDDRRRVERMNVDDSSNQSTELTRQTNLRQRKVGYSGPPTGDFQLPSIDDPHNTSSTSSSDDDDDAPRNVPRKPTIDRNTAALRLQALHRRRQEAKEKKEMDGKSIYKPKSRKVYKGHRNARTMIKESNFWGNNFILSGSDCGHIFIWDRNSTEPVMLLEADKHVVNCVQPHPFDVLLASSGIDYDIKLWSPLQQHCSFDEERTKEVMHRNEIMLEETRDTITVPAAFMLRVLASINNIRSGRRADRGDANIPDDGQGAQESDSE